MARFRGVTEICANGGDSVCRAWPILLIARVFGLTSLPVESKASVAARAVSGRKKPFRMVCLLALFEEEPDLVVGIEKVVVPHVLGAVMAVLATSAELGHWMSVQRELC
jgi:hypothetical protein